MTNNKPPVWLLDIDGVLNATPIWRRDNGQLPPATAWPNEEWISTHAMAGSHTWRIVAARPVVDYLCCVHEWGLAEIRWHTTWQDQAPNVGQALGLPEFPVQPSPEYGRGGLYAFRDNDQWWKLAAAWRILHEGRRLVWTDDDAGTELTGLQRYSLRRAGALIITPNPSTGLIRRELSAISEFLGLE